MAFTTNLAAYVRKYGKQPNRLYDQENKEARKASNRKWRKRSNVAMRSISEDWESAAPPPPPKTEGWITV